MMKGQNRVVKKIIIPVITVALLFLTPGLIRRIDYYICIHEYNNMDFDNYEVSIWGSEGTVSLLKRLKKLGDYGEAEFYYSEILEHCAKAYYSEGKYFRAYQILKGLGRSAEDSEIMCEILSFSPLMDIICASEGDEITFGKYELDGDTNNGEEPLIWNVIKCEKDKKLILSKYYWESIPYCSSSRLDYGCDSIISCWLESENLYDYVFSPVEKEIILSQSLNDTNNEKFGTYLAGWSARLFILSVEEYNMVPVQNRVGIAPEKFKSLLQNKSVGYWLRTPGVDYDGSCYVDMNGDVQLIGDDNNNSNYIRPAVWVKIQDVEEE